ncbi:hypothetical protein CLF_103247 [Clonorchis sinensis]|uniref:Uncharacterized protein n=1 Tax=Clonorchis sinensis TaxID=79923 RepID=G7Y9E2_CLOSI|nr:hypothetical protein CLF_103247 [Clonorchis sinensis]
MTVHVERTLPRGETQRAQPSFSDNSKRSGSACQQKRTKKFCKIHSNGAYNRFYQKPSEGVDAINLREYDYSRMNDSRWIDRNAFGFHVKSNNLQGYRLLICSPSSVIDLQTMGRAAFGCANWFRVRWLLICSPSLATFSFVAVDEDIISAQLSRLLETVITTQLRKNGTWSKGGFQDLRAEPVQFQPNVTKISNKVPSRAWMVIYSRRARSPHDFMRFRHEMVRCVVVVVTAAAAAVVGVLDVSMKQDKLWTSFISGCYPYDEWALDCQPSKCVDRQTMEVVCVKWQIRTYSATLIYTKTMKSAKPEGENLFDSRSASRGFLLKEASVTLENLLDKCIRMILGTGCTKSICASTQTDTNDNTILWHSGSPNPIVHAADVALPGFPQLGFTAHLVNVTKLKVLLQQTNRMHGWGNIRCGAELTDREPDQFNSATNRLGEEVLSTKKNLLTDILFRRVNADTEEENSPEKRENSKVDALTLSQQCPKLYQPSATVCMAAKLDTTLVTPQNAWQALLTTPAHDFEFTGLIGSQTLKYSGLLPKYRFTLKSTHTLKGYTTKATDIQLTTGKLAECVLRTIDRPSNVNRRSPLTTVFPFSWSHMASCDLLQDKLSAGNVSEWCVLRLHRYRRILKHVAETRSSLVQHISSRSTSNTVDSVGSPVKNQTGQTRLEQTTIETAGTCCHSSSVTNAMRSTDACDRHDETDVICEHRSVGVVKEILQTNQLMRKTTTKRHIRPDQKYPTELRVWCFKIQADVTQAFHQ